MNNTTARFGAHKNPLAWTKSRVVLCVALGLLAPLSLAACGSDAAGNDPAVSETSSVASQNAEGVSTTNAKILVGDAWAKSATAEDNAMSAVFMKLTNDSQEAITVLSARSESAEMVQLHETVVGEDGGSTMQEVDGGFELLPHSTRELAPGGDHVMLMMLTHNLVAGDTVDVQLELSDGTKMSVSAEIRDFKGAQETYSHEETSGDSGMDSDSDVHEH